MPLMGEETAWEMQTNRLSDLAVGRGCSLLEEDSCMALRAENQGQRPLTLSLEDGLLATGLSRRTFPRV